ncbi:MAG: molybdate ABC transporter substrate-binding protein [Nitrospiraceae bacterium]
MTRNLAFWMAMTIISGLGSIVTAEEQARAETLTVGAAQSLQAALQEIVPMFEKEYGATVRVVYGPSQTLRREIEKGAPIDVFLPAAVEEVEKLHAKGLTLSGAPRVYAQTSLVLVMSAASRAIAVSLNDALPNRATHLAIGDPRTSSLGVATARALTQLDPAYKTRFSLLYAQHNEDLVNLVHLGKADVGIVYRIDAINNGRLRIIDEAPVGTHTAVRFGEAVVSTCRPASMDTAKKFSDFMVSPRIQKLLLKYGFDPVPSKEAEMKNGSH